MNLLHSRGKRRRRGSILIAVLVCLLAVGLIGGGMLRMMTLQQRQLRLKSWRQQAVWLAESGRSRALRKLADDEAYRGERWQLDAQQLGGAHSGQVTIRIESGAGEADAQMLVVEAIFPHDPIDRVMHRIEVPLKKNPSGGAS